MATVGGRFVFSKINWGTFAPDSLELIITYLEELVGFVKARLMHCLPAINSDFTKLVTSRRYVAAVLLMFVLERAAPTAGRLFQLTPVSVQLVSATE